MDGCVTKIGERREKESGKAKRAGEERQARVEEGETKEVEPRCGHSV